MANYIRHSKHTGEVLSTGSNDITYFPMMESDDIAVRENMGDWNDADYYFDFVADTYRPKLALPYNIDKLIIINDGVDSITITAVPDNTRVTWPDHPSDEPGPIAIPTGEAVVWASLVQGAYTIELKNPIYLTAEIQIQVNPAP